MNPTHRRRTGFLSRLTSARFAVALAIVAASSVAVVVGTPSTASAASLVTPVEGLPSSIATGAGYAVTDAGKLGNANVAAMAWIYKLATTPELQAALKSQSAGTATKTETDLIADAATKIKLPVAFGALSKVAGPATVAYTGYQIGGQIGAPIAGKVTMALWGEDANNLVCSVGNPGGVGQSLISFFAHQDCAKFNAAGDQQINTDAIAGLQAGTLTVNGHKWTMDGSSYGTQRGRNIFGGYCIGTDQGSSGYDSGPTVIYQMPNGKYASSSVDAIDIPAGYPGECGGTPTGSSGAHIFTSEVIGLYQRAGLDYPTGDTAADYVKQFTPKCWIASTDGVDVTDHGCSALSGETDITQGTADPDRSVSCDVTSTDGHTYSTSGGTFRESESDWTQAIPACPSLDAGQLPANTTLTLHTVGGADKTLWTHDLDPEVTKAYTGKFANCLSTVCQTLLEKADGQSCFDGNQTQCAGWFTDPNKTDDYKCTYGGVDVGLDECKVYGPSFEPDRSTDTGTYGDPYTGKAAVASPVASESTAADPSDDTQIQKSPALDPDDSTAKCFASTFGTFNPLIWVERPVQCAMSWAFIPPANTLTSLQTKIAQQAEDTMPGKLASTVGALSLSPPADGCDGIAVPSIDVGQMHLSGIHLLSACPGEALAPVAGVAKVIGGFAFIALGILALTRIVGSPFGFAGLGGKGDTE